ncbi:signal recognition particle-docking protein FtsY [bacterium]|nr:MAG: signal recognition particle-docking protein FtsY [bacterium]RKZ17142.1 MAG: signal recognition particle-docking protein FtsY [bacterium]
MVLSALRKLRAGLGRTRESVVGRISAALKREVYLTDDFLEEVEEILISSDVGVDAAVQLTEGLGKRLRDQQGQATMEDVTRSLQEEVTTLLANVGSDPPVPATPVHVILAVGVNGVGKTTSIAKLARWHQEQGRKVLLAAGDTFRAAAVEQLSVWADRLGVDIVKQEMGADPAAVAFDALGHARAAGHDVVIIDTAGRLQTREGLMRELEKIARVVKRQVEDGPHETLLVLDANTGQNGIIQAREFSAVAPLDAIFLTKLDGSAKGGIVVAIARNLDIPVRYVGTGESASDFAVFDAPSFAEGLFTVEPEADQEG